jgi:hypothetical protein
MSAILYNFHVKKTFSLPLISRRKKKEKQKKFCFEIFNLNIEFHEGLI